MKMLKVGLGVGAFVVAAALLSVSCAGSGTPAGGSNPNTPPTICPDNPSLCSGSCCGDQCVDVMTDAKNCGACGAACPAGTQCGGGKCGCPTPGGGAAMMCSAATTCCSTGCKNLQTDAQNCGACGRSCNGAACNAGTCGAASVDMGTPSTGDGGSCTCTKTCLTQCLFGCCLEDLLTSMCNPDPACLGGGGLGDLGLPTGLDL